MERKNVLCFDMDGTFVDFYGVEGWLDDLENHSTRPYEVAKPLVNLSAFARLLNRLQIMGYEIRVISWGSKSGDDLFLEAVKEAKMRWLAEHLASVEFDEIDVLPYGTPKWSVLGKCGEAILFDDEIGNRKDWEGTAFNPEIMFEILKELLN